MTLDENLKKYKSSSDTIEYVDILKAYRKRKNNTEKYEDFVSYIVSNFKDIVKKYDEYKKHEGLFTILNKYINIFTNLVYGSKHTSNSTLDMYSCYRIYKYIERELNDFRSYIIAHMSNSINTIYLKNDYTFSITFLNDYINVDIKKKKENLKYGPLCPDTRSYICYLNIVVGNEINISIPFIYNRNNEYLNRELTDKCIAFTKLNNIHYSCILVEIINKYMLNHSSTDDYFSTSVANDIMIAIAEIPLPRNLTIKSDHYKLDTKLTYTLNYIPTGENTEGDLLDEHISLTFNMEVLINDEHFLFMDSCINIEKRDMELAEIDSSSEEIFAFMNKLCKENILTRTMKY